MSTHDLIRQAGGPAAVAKICKVRPQAVSQWLASQVPLDRCAAIEAATSGQVRCEDLRPDVEWQRDQAGRPVGYLVRLAPCEEVESSESLGEAA